MDFLNQHLPARQDGLPFLQMKHLTTLVLGSDRGNIRMGNPFAPVVHCAGSMVDFQAYGDYGPPIPMMTHTQTVSSNPTVLNSLCEIAMLNGAAQSKDNNYRDSFVIDGEAFMNCFSDGTASSQVAVWARTVFSLSAWTQPHLFVEKGQDSSYQINPFPWRSLVLCVGGDSSVLDAWNKEDMSKIGFSADFPETWPTKTPLWPVRAHAQTNLCAIVFDSVSGARKKWHAHGLTETTRRETTTRQTDGKCSADECLFLVQNSNARKQTNKHKLTNKKTK